jgi:hypothetical protein
LISFSTPSVFIRQYLYSFSANKAIKNKPIVYNKQGELGMIIY